MIWSIIEKDEIFLIGHSKGIVGIILESDSDKLVSYDEAGLIIIWQNFI
jgi:hypothetical protein